MEYLTSGIRTSGIRTSGDRTSGGPPVLAFNYAFKLFSVVFSRQIFPYEYYTYSTRIRTSGIHTSGDRTSGGPLNIC